MGVLSKEESTKIQMNPTLDCLPTFSFDGNFKIIEKTICYTE